MKHFSYFGLISGSNNLAREGGKRQKPEQLSDFQLKV